jgi:cysteinyl-tRNA synthetase
VDDHEAQLLREQLLHMLDNLDARLAALDARYRSDRALSEERLTGIEQDLSALQTTLADHEQRLRATGEGVTQLKVWCGLGSGGSGLLALAAALRAFFGG